VKRAGSEDWEKERVEEKEESEVVGTAVNEEV